MSGRRGGGDPLQGFGAHQAAGKRRVSAIAMLVPGIRPVAGGHTDLGRRVSPGARSGVIYFLLPLIRA